MPRMNYADYFKGKKVTVMGLGLLGRGVGDAAFLASMGAEVLVTDLKTEAELASSIDQLSKYPEITFVLGEHREEDFVNRDFILVNPGVHYTSPYLEAARAAGVSLKQSAAWFAELSGVPVVGVTGTRGKSTVTHMIHHVLTQVTGEEVLLGGNVRGVSSLALLNHVREDSLCVMELDSWQLQAWGWASMSPQVAVFTNFMEDHLNYYERGDKIKEEAMDLYFADKANIFRYQEESGMLVTTPEVFERAKQLSGVTLGQEVVLVDDSVIPDDALLAMPGAHNRMNAALALEALRALSLTEDEIFAGLASFPGVPGRLEYLGERDGVKVYNDNNATTPQATIEGLRAVGNVDDKNVILLCGGADKNIDPAPLAYEITQYCKQVVMLPGSGTDKLSPLLHGGEVGVSIFADLPQAVAAGLAAGAPGDVFLFSPGFASFGMFANEYERNDAFVALLNEQEKTDSE